MGRSSEILNPTCSKPTVGIVGPCGAGKTTLAQRLLEVGVSARHIAQEHSYVADMWKRMTDPEILVFLDASFEVATKRRRLNWTVAEFQEQLNRLCDARGKADLYIMTDELTPQEVFERVFTFIQERI